MAGPNQTGSILQTPVSNALGYGDALQQQVTDDAEEKRRKAMLAAQARGGASAQPQLSQMLGM